MRVHHRGGINGFSRRHLFEIADAIGLSKLAALRVVNELRSAPSESIEQQIAG
jgi:hypothetical protein